MTKLQAAPVKIQIHNMDITDIVHAIQSTKVGTVKEASSEEIRYLIAHIQDIASLAAHDCLHEWMKRCQQEMQVGELVVGRREK